MALERDSRALLGSASKSLAIRLLVGSLARWEEITTHWFQFRVPRQAAIGGFFEYTSCHSAFGRKTKRYTRMRLWCDFRYTLGGAPVSQIGACHIAFNQNLY